MNRQVLVGCLVCVSFAFCAVGKGQLLGPGVVVNQGVELVFEGPDLEAYVQLLRTQFPELNVIVDDDINGLALRRLSLKNVSPTGALRVVDTLLPEVDLDHLPQQPGASPIYYLRRKRNLNAIQRSTAIISVRTLLDGDFEMADLLSVIEKAVTLRHGSRQTPKLSLHEETGILLVDGNRGQIATIGEVVTTLKRTRNEASDSAIAKLADRISELESRIRRLEGPSER